MPAPHPTSRSAAALTRRDLFGLTGAGALSLFWDGWQRAAAGGPVNRPRARSVILIFNCGAPSHLDLFDPKPDAPSTKRFLGPRRLTFRRYGVDYSLSPGTDSYDSSNGYLFYLAGVGAHPRSLPDS